MSHLTSVICLSFLSFYECTSYHSSLNAITECGTLEIPPAAKSVALQEERYVEVTNYELSRVIETGEPSDRGHNMGIVSKRYICLT